MARHEVDDALVGGILPEAWQRDLTFGELSDPYLLEAVSGADSAAFPALPAIPVRRTAHTFIDYAVQHAKRADIIPDPFRPYSE